MADGPAKEEQQQTGEELLTAVGRLRVLTVQKGLLNIWSLGGAGATKKHATECYRSDDSTAHASQVQMLPAAADCNSSRVAHQTLFSCGRSARTSLQASSAQS